jgi:hypothetical protein
MKALLLVFIGMTLAFLAERFQVELTKELEDLAKKEVALSSSACP